MKSGLNIADFATEIRRQAAQKHDYVMPTGVLGIVPEGDRGVQVAMTTKDGVQTFTANDVFHDQLASHLRIPRDYYRRVLADDRDLFIENANHWLRHTEIKDEKRLIRTLDTKARALLSNGYRTIDNFGLAEAVLPVLQQHGLDLGSNTEFSANVTDKRFYVKAVNTRLKAEVKVGEVISAGIQITNSEVGFGSVEISPLIYTLRCSNGMVMQDFSLKRRHVGKRHETIDVAYEVLSDEAREAADRAFFLEVRDRTKHALDEAVFRKTVERLQAAAQDKITGDIPAVMDVTRRALGLDQAESGSILNYLAAGGDVTRWGLSSAITRFSQDVTDYDRASELERIGGELIEMPQRDWKRIAEATAN
jgi:hypothetical protein